MPENTLESLAEQLNIDFRQVSMNPPTKFVRKAVCNPLFHYPWGFLLQDGIMQDEWGVKRILNSTRTQSRIVSHPLDDDDALEHYELPDADAEGRFDQAEAHLRRWTERYAVSGSWGGDGLFMQAWYLRGFNKFLVDMISRPKIADRILDGLLGFFLDAGKRLAELGVDVVCIGDDVAMQTGMIISPALWRRYFKTRLAEIVRAVKKRGCRVAFHSDGNCEAIIPDLVEIGVDILDPIQPECMNPLRIKQLYGDRLTLSGTISLQSNLAFGSVDSVKEEVRDRIRTLAHHGGFIISPSNQATIDISVHNFVAVYTSAREFGSYPIA